MPENDAGDFASEISNDNTETSTLGQPKSLQKSINESLEYTREHEGVYRKGETKSTNHQIYEMNEFYIEMVDRLKKLRLDYMEEEEFTEDDGSCGGGGESVLSEVVNAIKKKRNDPEIKRQIDTILKLDLEIDENSKTLKSEKLDRESIQHQLYEALKSDTELDKNSEILYEMYKHDGGDKKQNLDKVRQAQTSFEKLGGSSSKKKEKGENNKFIRRNIELAKNSQEMGNLSLTDEEKVKLESLLVDVDTIVDDGSTALVTDDSDPHSTGYHFDDDERTLLAALDKRLKEIGDNHDNGNLSSLQRILQSTGGARGHVRVETPAATESPRQKEEAGDHPRTPTSAGPECGETPAKAESPRDFGKYAEGFEEVERNNGGDKFWKIEQRLRNIEEELLSYQSDKEKSSGDENEKIDIEPGLLKCPPEIEPGDNMRETAMRLVSCYESEYDLVSESIHYELDNEEVEKYDLETEEVEKDKDEYCDEDGRLRETEAEEEN